MRILITGSPGVGKTVIAARLGKLLKCKVINESDFAIKHKIGEWDSEQNELVIPLRKIEKRLNSLLKREDNVIVEGHTLCETKLKVDAVVLLRVNPEVLENRLSKKNYSAEKVMDNVFCEGIDYCKKHAMRRYKKGVIEMRNEENLNKTVNNIIEELKSRRLLG